jgi:SP family facilitated glucose transporter-like MFS transporter 3
MALQQFGGINAVMFYSTPVLRPLLPNAAGLLGIGITLVNAIMTLPAIFLVDVSHFCHPGHS